jgi:hypothetical protein
MTEKQRFATAVTSQPAWRQFTKRPTSQSYLCEHDKIQISEGALQKSAILYDMNLKIDNLDGYGPRDYTPAIDSSRSPQIVKQLNQAAELRFSLVTDGPEFVVPVVGARVTLGKTNGQDVFAGYLVEQPVFEYLGWGERGPIHRYNLLARSDEVALDRKRPSNRSPFVDRSAGDALRQLTEDLLAGSFDTSGVQDLDVLPSYACDPRKKWSEHAAQIALRARASYRMGEGTIEFAPLGATVLALDESDSDFSPSGLTLHSTDGLLNDLTVIGQTEPSAYVTDYFVGDGLSLRFYLSQSPFTRMSRTLVDEEYKNATLDPVRWSVSDPNKVISLSGGELQIAGGTGVDGGTTVLFAEKLELGGALVLQHGNFAFGGASDAVIGGLYPGNITAPGCLAGFRVVPDGGQSTIQAVVNGALAGPILATVAGHQYSFTTRLYAPEIYRTQQVFHSSLHPPGHGRGGAAIAADVRVVLEVHDIDPANPATLVTPSTVLYDAVIPGVSGFCKLGLVNASRLYCAVTFTRLMQAVDAEVRSALPGQTYRTRLVGSLADGAECLVTQDPALQFFPQHVPAANELIGVRYRGRGTAMARVTDPTRAVPQGVDDGVRGAVLDVQAPAPRTAVDCENAALALMDDRTGPAWSGVYETWSDFLPGDADDVFPGDAVHVNVPSRGADFHAIVRQVKIEVKDLAGEHSRYQIQFADDPTKPLAFEFGTGHLIDLSNLTIETLATVGSNFLPHLTSAEITQVSSTTVTIDAGFAPGSGEGIEVRRSDQGWNQGNDRNLVGRFATQVFTVPRLSRVQDYFLRRYDVSTPAKYSRYSAALHVDFPL